LSDLRYSLCPRKMREEVFWRIYFLLLLNKKSVSGRKQQLQPSPRNATVKSVELSGLSTSELERYFEAIVTKQHENTPLSFDEGIDAACDSYFAFPS